MVKNVVVVCSIFLEQHFAVIIMVIMSYVPALKTEYEGVTIKVCKNTNGVTNRKRLRDTTIEGMALH